MSLEPAAGLLAAAACGLAGLGVPALVGSLSGPTGALATLPGLRWRASLLAAVAGAVVGGSLGRDWALLVLLPLVPVEVALGLVDRHTHLLPTRLIWPSLAVAAVLAGVAALLAEDGGAIVGAVVGGLGSLVIFHALWWIHPSGMGYGDVRLATLVGFQLGFLGAAELLAGVYTAFVLFAVVGIGRAVLDRRWAAMREPLPFGPFLLVGALVGVVVGAYLASG